ncbi:succinate dehydrogenase assembly factor 3, mitochondrial isoform X1 [Cottoperca gobio]|uniref:Succinate dehydrogenase assembly factor 3, mitochondrial isoform X1 n=1 Tax=Cottoperca gobio TaxID=56716 RepID=A0A6J2QP64_COTGO|nr:succinate dehydrogenase assembly factor 3, mitochondrial isoform X1 [Cottoperca gobio]
MMCRISQINGFLLLNSESVPKAHDALQHMRHPPYALCSNDGCLFSRGTDGGGLAQDDSQTALTHHTRAEVNETVHPNYKDTLQTQVLESARGQLSSVKFGSHLPEGELGNFQGDQIGQLYELMLESTKSSRQFDIQEDGK